MNIAVIIPAAGKSTRFAENDPLAEGRSKLDEDLAGRPVLQRTVELFNKRDDVGAIIVAGPCDEAAFAEFSLRHADRMSMLGATLCRGGENHRYESVKAALELVPDDATHIAVHDAARPAASPELIDRIFDAASRHPAVIPAVDCDDTLKRVEQGEIEDESSDPLAAILGDNSKPTLRRVEATLDRANVVLVQTPQVFERELLICAYAQADLASTDDAGLVERLGEPVLVVAGETSNIKITRPRDVELCRYVMSLKPPKERSSRHKF